MYFVPAIAIFAEIWEFTVFLLSADHFNIPFHCTSQIGVFKTLFSVPHGETQLFKSDDLLLDLASSLFIEII